MYTREPTYLLLTIAPYYKHQILSRRFLTCSCSLRLLRQTGARGHIPQALQLESTYSALHISSGLRECITAIVCAYANSLVTSQEICQPTTAKLRTCAISFLR